MTTGPQRPLVLPRFGTPRNPDRQTRGGELAEVAARLGKPLLPWQRHVADVSLEIDPDTGGLWYTEIDLTIMRQCGKTMGYLWPWLVWRSTVVPHRLGRQQSVFTEQDRNKARMKLELDMAADLRDSPHFQEITNPKGRPGRSTKQWKLGLNNGSEHLLFGRGNYIHIETPSEKAGHSRTLDAGAIDEARFHQDSSTEDGIVPTMATRQDAQLLVTSTAGNHLSYYLWSKVVAGRKAVETDAESRVAFFDYSLPEDADLDDPAVWWEFHPALGHTIDIGFIFDKLDKARRSPDPDKAEDGFRNEYANQWIRTPVLGDGLRPLIIPVDKWNRQTHTGQVVSTVRALAVDVSPDGASASIVLAGRNTHGALLVDVLKLEAGTFWLEAELRALIAEHRPVAVAYDAGNPATAAAAGAIARAAGTTTVVKLNGAEWCAACEAFRIGIVEGHYWHRDQDWLNAAMAGAGKKSRGAGWLWDRATALSDISPLGAATAAARAFEMNQPIVRRSAYEDSGLTTV